jgi:hypothetical protein
VNARAEKATADFAEFASIFYEKVFVNVTVYADATGTHDPKGYTRPRKRFRVRCEHQEVNG